MLSRVSVNWVIIVNISPGLRTLPGLPGEGHHGMGLVIFFPLVNILGTGGKIIVGVCHVLKDNYRKPVWPM